MANYKCDSLVNTAWRIHNEIFKLPQHPCWYNNRVVVNNNFGDGTFHPILTIHIDSINHQILTGRPMAELFPTNILNFYCQNIAPVSLESLYKFYSKEELNEIYKSESSNMDASGLKFVLLNPMNSFMIYPVENINDLTAKINAPETNCLEDLMNAQSYILTTACNLRKDFNEYQDQVKCELVNVINEYNRTYEGVSNYVNFVLLGSLYGFEFHKNINSEYQFENKSIVIDYILPNKEDVPILTLSKSNKTTELSVTKQRKIYDEVIYAIVIRSLAEIFHFDEKKYINHICFNGKIKDRSPITGQMEEKYILSVNVSREQIESLNLEYINSKECFKHLKGVSASKLYEQTEIIPIITPSFSDKRIVKAKNVEADQHTNLAEMDWEEFEHLVRQVFEWEFSDKGGEVNVTQSSRDGGVDAIVFDPDPIRGGKIIIQAKRYTNTVPVSAVRDLYGTIINEGANKGILITTSDYGPDSYKFAQGKPITLLNGGHLLYLMQKHGHNARIDIQLAKNNFKNKL